MKNYRGILILYEDNHLLVVVKKENILSQADITKDLDMLTLLKEYLKETYKKPGNVYLGLVHRLDRRVGGVMVFAKSSKAASRLSEQIRNHEFKKEYIALVIGKTKEEDKLVDYIIKDDYVAKDDFELGKESILLYTKISEFYLDEVLFSALRIKLLTGRYNQIRFQLSKAGYPIIDDFKYGYKGNNYNDQLGLWCYKLSFYHPITKELISFNSFNNVGIWGNLNNLNNIENLEGDD